MYKPIKTLRLKLLRPSFGLATLFSVIAIISLCLAIHQSHLRAQAKLRLANKRIQSAVGATKEILFDEASTRFRLERGDENGSVPDMSELYAYLKASASEKTFSNLLYGGVWKGESKLECTVALYGHYSTKAGKFANHQTELDGVVYCRSPWYIFAGGIVCDVKLEEARLNQDFVMILSQRLADLDISVSTDCKQDSATARSQFVDSGKEACF